MVKISIKLLLKILPKQSFVPSKDFFACVLCCLNISHLIILGEPNCFFQILKMCIKFKKTCHMIPLESIKILHTEKTKSTSTKGL